MLFFFNQRKGYGVYVWIDNMEEIIWGYLKWKKELDWD